MQTTAAAILIPLCFMLVLGCTSDGRTASSGGSHRSTASSFVEDHPDPARPGALFAGSGDVNSRTGGISAEIIMRGEENRAADLHLAADGTITFYGGSAAILRGLAEREDQTTVLTPTDEQLARILELMAAAGWINRGEIPDRLQAAPTASRESSDDVSPEGEVLRDAIARTDDLQRRGTDDNPRQADPSNIRQSQPEANFRVTIATPTQGGDRFRVDAAKDEPAFELIDFVAGLVVYERFPELRP